MVLMVFVSGGFFCIICCFLVSFIWYLVKISIRLDFIDCKFILDIKIN